MISAILAVGVLLRIRRSSSSILAGGSTEVKYVAAISDRGRLSFAIEPSLASYLIYFGFKCTRFFLAIEVNFSLHGNPFFKSLVIMECTDNFGSKISSYLTSCPIFAQYSSSLLIMSWFLIRSSLISRDKGESSMWTTFVTPVRGKELHFLFGICTPLPRLPN